MNHSLTQLIALLFIQIESRDNADFYDALEVSYSYGGPWVSRHRKAHPKANNSLLNRILNSQQNQIPLRQNGITSRQNENPHGGSEFHGRSNCHGGNNSFDEVEVTQSLSLENGGLLRWFGCFLIY